MKTSLISHIFNEEYLLPFWLNHHKNMFDKIYIVDYNSTDKSIEICKSICPDCVIIPSQNKWFDAQHVDSEIMQIETIIGGIKIVLNTTEFLFCKKPIKDLFIDNDDTNPISFSVDVVTPHSINEYNVDNLDELFRNLLNRDVVYHTDRGMRQLHNFPNGKYGTGRHYTCNPYVKTNEAHIVWMGFYPMNDNLLKRKLQIKQKIPQSNIDKNQVWSEDEMLSINYEKSKNGKSLKDINLSLYELLNAKCKTCTIYHPELLNNDLKWGADYVMIDNDINLLKNVNAGYLLLNIDNYNKFLHTFMQNEIKFITGKTVNLHNYHNELTNEEHTKIINSMPYKKNMYSDIRDFCIYLETHISTLLNEPVKIFNDDIWVRICRPSCISQNDFNPCHKDVYLDFYRNTVNIYLPIVGSNEKSSLKIQPGSHKWSESETIVTKGGACIDGKKYSVDAIVASVKPLNMIRPNPTETQLMLFSPYSIHGCSDNDNENITRMSLEIRFMRNDKNRVIEQESKYRDFVKNRNWR
jgi:hypothetical protein